MSNVSSLSLFSDVLREVNTQSVPRNCSSWMVSRYLRLALRVVLATEPLLGLTFQARLILGAFTKLRKVTTSFVMSVRPFECRRMEQLGSYWTDFDEVWRCFFFRKYIDKIQVLLKSDKNNCYLTWRRFHIYDNISLNSSYNEKYLRSNLTEHQNTHFMFNNFFSKNRVVYENIEIYGGARDAANGNMAGRCMPD